MGVRPRRRIRTVVSREKVFLLRKSDKHNNKTVSANIIMHRYPYLYNSNLNRQHTNNSSGKFKWSIIQIIDGFSNKTEAENFYWTWKKKSRGPKRRINECINLVRKWKHNNPSIKMYVVPPDYHVGHTVDTNSLSYR